jgi:acetyltransferase
MPKKIELMDALLNPESIAVIGASRDPASVGYGVLKSLLKGCVFDAGTCNPFKGRVYAVNPNADEVQGVKCHKSVLEIPGPVGMAVVCVRASLVPQVLWDCASKGVKAVIIVSAGFAEAGAEGKKLQDEIVSIARQNSIAILGPNCLGLIRPSKNLNASFALASPSPGSVAFISQSGALSDSVIDWAIENKYPFSLLASIGNAADTDVCDFVEWCEQDPQTKSIAIYLEGLADGQRFMQVCSRVSQKKPIVLLKAGRSAAGARSAGAHTGSLVGSYRVWKAACRQSGVILADDFEELFYLAGIFAKQRRSSNNNIVIITNGGGAGVLCADYCEEFGVHLVDLDEETLAQLDATGKMHPAYSRRNPLDIVGDALPERYKAAVDTVIGKDYVGGMIVMQTLQTMTDTVADAKIVVEAARRHPEKPVVCVFMGGKFTRPGSQLLVDSGIAEFCDPRKAARAMAALLGLL